MHWSIVSKQEDNYCSWQEEAWVIIYFVWAVFIMGMYYLFNVHLLYIMPMDSVFFVLQGFIIHVYLYGDMY
jgi:hypothetical protein